MKTDTTTRLRFIGRSLLWSLLLYSCAICIVHWNDIRNVFVRQQSPVAYTNSNPGVTSVKISIDSLQKSIRMIDGVIRHIRTLSK